MKIFSKEKQIKRVIFNVDADIAARLEQAKNSAKMIGKKLDVDSVIDKALEKFLKKSEKKIAELLSEANSGKLTIRGEPHDPTANAQDTEDAQDLLSQEQEPR